MNFVVVVVAADDTFVTFPLFLERESGSSCSLRQFVLLLSCLGWLIVTVQ